ncbi:MAG: hypothetical protein WC399_00810 [Bacilli bacterium]
MLMLAGCTSSIGSSVDSFSSSETSSEAAPVFYPRGRHLAKQVEKITRFPNIPSSYRYYDYKQAAHDLDEVVFDFASNPEVVFPDYRANDPSTWQPMGYWLDQPRQPEDYNPLETGYLRRTFGLPTYVGDNRVASSGSEAMTTIASVLGSSFAGIDKQSQPFDDRLYDFVEMTFSSYDTGTKLVHNYGVQGQSFWYDLFPQILFTRLYDLYPTTPYMREMVINGADQWLEALPYFVKEETPNYEFVGYNVVLESPTVTGGHIEPPNGGLAFIFYAAYQITGETKYLDGCREVLDYLQDYQKNPNYEALTDYAPYVAAVLNVRHGTDYDVGKFIDYLFDGDSSFRSGWAVMNGSFGSYPVNGLVGQAGDYAFAMNSFHLASTLAPLVKYDPRYGDAIGKYMVNLVNNARVFFPQEHSLSHQSMNSYLPFDLNGALMYEGFRNNYNSVNGYAMGDATTMFSQPSDLSVYSSAFVGALGAIVEETSVKGILKLDLNATDSFGFNDYEHYLFYNPYDVDTTIVFEGSGDDYSLYDLASNSILARNVTRSVNLAIPASASLVVAVLPGEAAPLQIADAVVYDDEILTVIKPSVTLPGLRTKQELTSSSDIAIDYVAPEGDEVTSMSISFGDIQAYDGIPVTTFRYDKDNLPDTDYTMKIEITTALGRHDYVTKRVVCR